MEGFDGKGGALRIGRRRQGATFEAGENALAAFVEFATAKLGRNVARRLPAGAFVPTRTEQTRIEKRH